MDHYIHISLLQCINEQNHKQTKFEVRQLRKEKHKQGQLIILKKTVLNE